jgi:hypothetical protein
VEEEAAGSPSEGKIISVNYSGFVQRRLEASEVGLPLLCERCDARERAGDFRTQVAPPLFVEGRGWTDDCS